MTVFSVLQKITVGFVHWGLIRVTFLTLALVVVITPHPLSTCPIVVGITMQLTRTPASSGGK